MKTRTINKSVKINQELIWVGVFKQDKTYSEAGKSISYEENGYTSHKKGSTFHLYQNTLPEFVTMGDIRESIIHLVPSRDLIWEQKWIEKH